MSSLVNEPRGSAAVAQAPQRQGNVSVVLRDTGEEAEEPVEPYYWQEGGDRSVSWWVKLRHQAFWGGVQAIAGAEAVGEVVANTLGLTDSKYQYVIDALEVEEYRRQREERDRADDQEVVMQFEVESKQEEDEVESQTKAAVQSRDEDTTGIELAGAGTPRV